jgi:UDP-glucose 4-epimerase
VADDDGRAAVIGASGFIGGALTRELRRQRVATSCFTRESPFIDDSGHLHPDLISADTIFWLAGSIRPATVSDTADGAVTADHNALVSLLRGLEGSGAGGRRRIVAVSSGGTVYDPHAPSPHAEDGVIAPANQYGTAMLAIESLIRASSPNSVVLRASNAYGPGQPARRGQGVIAYWLEAIAASEPIQVIGSEDVARDYVYIDDITAALVGVHAASTSPAVVNIGAGVPTTLHELVDLVQATVAPRKVIVRHAPARSFDAPSTWLDISLAAEALGWKPRCDLPTGLRETWRQWDSS